MNETSKCPVTGKSARAVAGGGTSNREWWPLFAEAIRRMHGGGSLAALGDGPAA